MRTTRLQAILPLALLLSLPGVAGAANCYSIYDAKNQLTFQSTVAPVDLSTRISQSMRERFPGAHLVIVPDDEDCREYRTGPILSPRFDSRKGRRSREQTIEAPLLRGAAAPVGSEAATTKSGTNLNIRKP